MFDQEIITRTKALSLGLKFYFTGEPCKNGGVAKRYVSSHGCCCDSCRAIVNSRNKGRWTPEKRRAYMAQWYKAAPHYTIRNENAVKRRKNPGVALRQDGWAEKKIQSAKDRVYRWRSDNPQRFEEIEARRRARKLHALPKWYGELDELVMKEAVDLRVRRSAATGIEWHIDHMVPLQSREACGLHCASNFQVIPASMNLTKGNRMVLCEPLQWLSANAWRAYASTIQPSKQP